MSYALQSTNEELETTNEELQSTSGELHTVNEEVRIRGGEVDFIDHAARGAIVVICADEVS